MKLRGREKFFWERNFNIKNTAAIPAEISGITGIDSEHDDEFFFFLTSRVTAVGEIYLRCTNVTDEGVRHISTLKRLRELTLKDHRQVTAACLPYLNRLSGLEYLDISTSAIAPGELYALTGLKKLKQLVISSDTPANEFAGELDKLKRHFQGCDITVY